MPTQPPTCNVFVNLETLLATDPFPAQAALVINNVQAWSPPGSGVMVQPGTQVIPCDYYGNCSAEVIASVSANVAYQFEIQITDVFGQIATTTLGWSQVPNQESLDLSTVTFTKNSDGSN